MPHRIKQHILEELRAAEGGWVTGERLREPFGVSRVAISKQIASLKERGYIIESSTRKGHRLLSEPDDLSPEILYPLLAGTRFAKGPIRRLEVTGSTNDDAKALAAEGAPEGSLVVAEFQEKGRGRRGRSWVAKQGEAVMVSLLLRPPLEPMRCGLLPLLTAAAIREALTGLGIEGVGIKWPNDLLVDGRKLAGILCEISSDFDRVDHAVVGFGLNVHSGPESFPEELRDMVCSLDQVSGTIWRRSGVLAAILKQMDILLDELWEGRPENVLAVWRRGNVTLGSSIVVTMPDGSVLKGMAEDLDAGGALLLRQEDGSLKTLNSGEVSLKPPAASRR